MLNIRGVDADEERKLSAIPKHMYLRDVRSPSRSGTSNRPARRTVTSIDPVSSTNVKALAPQVPPSCC